MLLESVEAKGCQGVGEVWFCVNFLFGREF